MPPDALFGVYTFCWLRGVRMCARTIAVPTATVMTSLFPPAMCGYPLIAPAGVRELHKSLILALHFIGR